MAFWVLSNQSNPQERKMMQGLYPSHVGFYSGSPYISYIVFHTLNIYVKLTTKIRTDIVLELHQEAQFFTSWCF